MFSNFSCEQLKLTRVGYDFIVWAYWNPNGSTTTKQYTEAKEMIERIDAELVRKCRVQH